MILSLGSMFELGNVSMDNSKFPHFPPTGSSTDPEWEQYWPETEPQQQQAATFAGLFASTHTAQQAQMEFPAATGQIPEPRQLDDLNIVQLPAAQYLPPTPSSQHAFQLLETYQPTFFEEQSSFDHSSAYDQSSAIVPFGQKPIYSNPSDFWEDIEQLMKDLNEDYVPFQPLQITLQSHTITFGLPENKLDSSVYEHFKRSLPEVVEKPRKSLRISTSSSNTGTSANISSGIRASARTSTNTDAVAAKPTKGVERRILIKPASGPENVPSVVPPLTAAVAANVVQPQSDNPAEDYPVHWEDEFVIYTGIKPTPYKCGFEGCGKTYAKKQVVRKHMFTHRRFSMYECDYQSCANDPNRYYRDLADLARHTRSRHTKVRPYTCYFCSQTFLRSDHARYHMRSKHSEKFERWLKKHGRGRGFNPSVFDWKQLHDKQWTCIVCCRKFSSPEILRSHILSKHSVNSE